MIWRRLGRGNSPGRSPGWSRERKTPTVGKEAIMRSIIRQSVVLPSTATALYAMYMDPAIHEAITGAPVTIGATPGAPFRAFEGRLSGTMHPALPRYSPPRR